MLTYVFLLLSLFLTLSLQTAEACFPFTVKTHVTVGNDLGGPPAPPLRIHCASKDDDFGFKNLTYHQEFSFTFCPIPYDTLFFCHFWWNGKSKAFDVYNANPFKKFCANEKYCYFAVRPDGFYISYVDPPRWFKRVVTW